MLMWYATMNPLAWLWVYRVYMVGVVNKLLKTSLQKHTLVPSSWSWFSY